METVIENRSPEIGELTARGPLSECVLARLSAPPDQAPFEAGYREGAVTPLEDEDLQFAHYPPA